MATGVEMLGQMSEDINLAGPVQGGNMVVKPNEAPVGAASILSKQLRNQANKGVAGIYELPEPQDNIPAFMRIAQEGVERQAAGQRNMYPNNFADDEGGILELPRNLRTAPGVPETSLAYITDEEKAILGLLKPGTPHRGPEDVPSYDSLDYVAAPSKKVKGAKQSSYDTGKKIEKKFRDQERREQQQDRRGTGEFNTKADIEKAIQETGARTSIKDIADTSKEEVVEDKETISTLSGVGDQINELDLTDDEKLLVTQAQNALAQGNQSKAQSIINSINNEKLNSIFDNYSPKKGDDEKTAKDKKNRFAAVMGLLSGNPIGFIGEFLGGPSKEDVLAALRAGETLTLDEQNVAAGLLLADQNNPDVLTDDQLEMLKGGSGFTSQDQLDKMIKSYREGEEMGLIDSLKSFGKGGAIRPDGSISWEGLSKGLTRADKRMLKSTDPELYARLNFSNTVGGMEDLGKEQYIKHKIDKDGNKISLTDSEKAFNRRVMEAREISSRNKDRNRTGGGYSRPAVMEEETIDEAIVEPGDTTMPYKGPRTGDKEQQVPLKRRFTTDPTKKVAQYTTTPRTQDEIYKYMTEGTTGEGIGLEPFSEYQRRRRKAMGLEPLGLYG